MKKFRLGLAGVCVFVLLLSVTAIHAAPQAANFVGTWQMTMQGGGPGGGGQNRGGGGGGGQRGGGGGAQSLTITHDGDKFKVSHKTPRGEDAHDATVSGNTISWTEQRPDRNGDGNTRTIEFKATVDGDTMKGTMGSGDFSRPFTAKRSS